MNKLLPKVAVGALMLLSTACSSDERSAISNSADDEPRAVSRMEVLKELFERNASRHVVVVAHRACWAQGAPENSIPAIKACIAAGMDMIEIDVALTRDNVPVLMHDDTIDRTTNGSGRIAAISLQELSLLRLKSRGGGDNDVLTEVAAPTLEQALEAARGAILINLDIKSEAFEEAFEVVERLGMEDQILMKMAAHPNDEALASASFLGRTMFMPMIRECTPRYVRYVCSPLLSDAIPKYESYGPVAYEITFSTEGYLNEGMPVLAETGRRVWANTLAPHHAAGHLDEDALKDPNQVWGRLIELGVDIIQTDEPHALMRYLETSGRRQGD